MPASNIRRVFGIADDATAGGTSYDSLSQGYISDASTFWPVTGGTLDPGLERISRAAEVRGRRPVSPPLPFRAGPVYTVPGPAYRSILEKLFKKVLGGTDTVTGSAANGYTHTIVPLGFGATQLPAMYVQLIRDDLNHKASGAVANRLSLSFPLDAEGTFEAELHPLFSYQSNAAQPSVSFTDVDNVLMLRDAQVYLDGSGGALSSPAAPTLTGSTTGGTLAAGSYQYRIAAYNSNGSTVPGPEAASPVTTTGSTSSVTVSWAAVSGASGYRVYGRTASGELFMADVGSATSFVDTGGITPSGAMPTVNGTGGSIPDLVAFEFSFVNNIIKKWYAKRNIWTQSSVGVSPYNRVSKLWYPTEHKLGAEQDVTWALQFGNTNVAQDFARDFAQIQKITATVTGGIVPSSNPAVYESMQITIYNAVAGTGAGPDGLVARGDTMYRVEGGGFYSNSDASDVAVAFLNQNSAALT